MSILWRETDVVIVVGSFWDGGDAKVARDILKSQPNFFLIISLKSITIEFSYSLGRAYPSIIFQGWTIWEARFRNSIVMAVVSFITQILPSMQGSEKALISCGQGIILL